MLFLLLSFKKVFTDIKEKGMINMTQKGTVKWFDTRKGYGFIERKDEDEVFVHHSEIQEEGFTVLEEGQEVEFEVEETEKGPQAVDVVKV